MWILSACHMYFLSFMAAIIIFSNFTLFYCQSAEKSRPNCPKNINVELPFENIKEVNFVFWHTFFGRSFIESFFSRMSPVAIEMMAYLGYASIFATGLFVV